VVEATGVATGETECADSFSRCTSRILATIHLPKWPRASPSCRSYPKGLAAWIKCEFFLFYLFLFLLTMHVCIGATRQCGPNGSCLRLVEDRWWMILLCMLWRDAAML
jgi:hypothetical protein